MVGLPIGADTADYAAALEDKENVAAPSVAEIPQSNVEDAISALTNLGYQRIDAYRVVNIAAGKNPDADVSTLIKLALKEFASKEL